MLISSRHSGRAGQIQRSANGSRIRLCLGAILTLLLLTTHSVAAQVTTDDVGAIPPKGAILTNHVEYGTGGGFVYRLRDLPAGATLYVYAKGTSGDLDPFILLVADTTDIDILVQEILDASDAASTRGEDPLAAIGAVADASSLAWDDDSGSGYDATFQVEIPTAGDYLLTAGSALTFNTFGDFRIYLGTNMPEIARGIAPNEQGLEVEIEERAVVRASQTLTGTLTISDTTHLHHLRDISEGDILVAAVRPISGTLIPALILEDFGGKPLAIDNVAGLEGAATLTYTFGAPASNYRLLVSATASDGTQTGGTYALSVARNPETRSADTPDTFGPPIVSAPIPVSIRLEIDQVTDVDQKAENFTIVASVTTRWQDPALAFSPDTCNCAQRVLRTERVIADHLTRNNINTWPQSVIFNQQGERKAQVQQLRINPDGSAVLFERFTATLQAPDFSFRQFPFDTQLFYVRFLSIFEDDIFTLEPDEEGSGFGKKLGEEEWIFSNETFTTTVISVENRDQAVFSFTTTRHLDYYVFRIFLPVLLIILVSWITFFLRDYDRRIEVTSANLLLFIAYNFVIASELPRLGYLSFMDFVLISTFVISIIVLIINVLFRRLEARGNGNMVARWDAILIWLYPLLYLVGGLIVYLRLFPPWAN